ncbi:GNAT family protein [Microvirga sp. W0021]|uniref:GNAT family protein n=1 Tax=Hohaiivirga grylli TaxID=3133970 RepID=A0ABV0BH10_9HYPH
MTKDNKQTANKSTPIHIQTANFVMKTLDQDAAPILLDWFKLPEILDTLNLPHISFTASQVGQFIASFNNQTSYLIGITDKKSGSLIGFYVIRSNPQHRAGHIIVCIANKDFRGKNILAEATLAVRDEMFIHRNIDKLSAHVLESNRAALFNLIGSPDFIYEGALQKEHLDKNDNRLDVLVFSAIKPT